MSDVDVSQLTPATGRQGAPASGTYGEQADLARLQQVLPQPAQAPQAQERTLPPIRQLPPRTAAPLPANIAAPSDRPDDIPIAPPTAPPPPTVAEAPDERTIQLADLLSRSPRVSATTRRITQEWLNGLVR